MFLSPHHRKVAVSNYPGGWIGIKPLAPTLNWDNKYLSRCVGSEAHTAIVWCDNDRQPHELVRNESNLASLQPVPTVFDGEPCAEHNNYDDTTTNITWHTTLPNPPSGQSITVIAMLAPIIWQQTHNRYLHFFTDLNLYSNGCNYAFARYVRSKAADNISVLCYSNRGSIISHGTIPLGTAANPLWPANTWAIYGISIPNAGGTTHIKVRRPAGPAIDLSASPAAAALPFDGGGNSSPYLYTGAVSSNATNSRPERAYIGFVFKLPILLNESELIDLIDNPYQIFNW